MARVDNITGEMIELLRGKVDFYLLRGILPVARRWPKKPKPPYTVLQAEAMAVFSIAARTLKRITGIILDEWRKGSEGSRAQWTDTFKSIIMKYWKANKSIPLIALDYSIVETGIEFKVNWKVLQLYIDPGITERVYNIQTGLISKSDFFKIRQPIYFTLLNDDSTRAVAPYILFKIEVVIIIETYSDISYFRRTGTVRERWYTVNVTALAMTVSGALTANRIYAIPFVVPKDITLDRIAINCTTPVALGLVRLGIYANLNGEPGAKLLDAGEVSTAATGIKEKIIDQKLTGGNLYWLVVANKLGTNAFRVPALGGTINIGGLDRTLGTTVMTHYFAAFTYGVLPGSFPVPTVGSGIIYPAIFVRLSA